MVKHDTTYTPLQLAYVQVFGSDYCHVDERLNVLGANQCTTSADCTGARTCSRWGWCQGEHQCPDYDESLLQAIRPVWNAALYAANQTCGEVDEEEFDTQKLMTSWEECADAMQGAGFEYFNFNGEGEDLHQCRGCVNDSQDFVGEDAAASEGLNIYQITPNYPVSMVDEANNQQCKQRCSSTGPGFGADIDGCLSEDNIRKIRVSYDAETDRIKKIELATWAPYVEPVQANSDLNTYNEYAGAIRRISDNGYEETLFT